MMANRPGGVKLLSKSATVDEMKGSRGQQRVHIQSHTAVSFFPSIFRHIHPTAAPAASEPNNKHHHHHEKSMKLTFSGRRVCVLISKHIPSLLAEETNPHENLGWSSVFRRIFPSHSMLLSLSLMPHNQSPFPFILSP